VSPLAGILVAALGAAPAALPPVSVGNASGKFRGGPLDGLQVGEVVTPDGRQYRGLTPSRPGASPVPEAILAATEAFIAWHEDGTAARLRPHLRSGVVAIECVKQDRPCRRSPFTSLKFAEKVRANTPYYMPDHTVRVEWLYGDALFYISTLRLKKGRIASVTTAPAWMPIEVQRPGDDNG
jgi:hypothetical protein